MNDKDFDNKLKNVHKDKYYSASPEMKNRIRYEINEYTTDNVRIPWRKAYLSMCSLVLVVILLVSVLNPNKKTDKNGSTASSSSGIVTPVPTPTPCRCARTIAMWWTTDDDDKVLVDEAWWDFKQLYGDKIEETATSSGHIHSGGGRLQFFTMAGNADSMQDLELLISAQAAPDIVRIDHVYIQSLAGNGNLVNLETYNATAKLKDKFIDSCWEAMVDKNSSAIYGLPFDATTMIFGGKKSYLEDVGAKLPSTYEEFLAVGNSLKNQNYDIDIYRSEIWDALRISSTGPVIALVSNIKRLGGDILNEAETEAIFNDPKTGVKAFEMMYDQVSRGFLDTSSQNGMPGAIMEELVSVWPEDNSTIKDMTFGLLPQLKEGVPRYSALGLYSLAVVKTSNDPEAAFDFISHFATGKNSVTDEHYQLTFAKNNGLLPSIKDAAASAKFKDEYRQAFWDTSIEQLKLARSFRKFNYDGCDSLVEEELMKAIYFVIKGEKSPQTALDDAAAVVNEFLRRKTEEG